MKREKIFLLASVLFVITTQCLLAKDWSVDVTVAKDGSGDYTTITQAINANPNNGSDYVIYIKNGVYDEKIFIDKNNITLLGEDRDETIITQAILRRIWRETDPSDWGVATINIQNGVSGLTLANLTVRNNFADLNPDVPNNNDHTMAIRGGGDKVIIVNCNIVATGGDTLSLWNTDGGRFYHSGCYFEGYVDYVCPRGYCYISNSDFFGYNGNASIWHDGEGGKDHKFVLENSYFDGKNFGLGRFHRQSAFYLLDCEFSAEMNNGGINYVGDSTGGNDRDKLNYGVRTYYDRCMRESGNYDWHSDNLESAEGSPAREDITDEWTFGNTWQPEKEIHNLLECAFLPLPGYHAKEVDSLPVLSWLPGKNASSHLIYFGTDSTPDFLTEVSDTSYAISTALSSATKHYWRVNEVLASGDTIVGSLWNFYTKVTSAPAQASDPSPPVNDDFTRKTVPLRWLANTLEVDSFFIYLGSEENLELIAKQTGAYKAVYNLPEDTVYYWRVDSKNEIGTTQGELWYFNYRIADPTYLNSDFIEKHNVKLYPNPASDELTVSIANLNNENLTIFIFDVNGREIYQSKLGSINSQTLEHKIDLVATSVSQRDGLYFVQINLGANSSTFPLLVQ